MMLAGEQPAQRRRNAHESARGKRYASHGHAHEHAQAHEHGCHELELVQLKNPAWRGGR